MTTREAALREIINRIVARVHIECDGDCDPCGDTCENVKDIAREAEDLAFPPSPVEQAKEKVIEAARRWNKTTEYQNVDAARRGEDKKIKDLQDALAALSRAQDGGEGR